jgi:hypothetical protein
MLLIGIWRTGTGECRKPFSRIVSACSETASGPKPGWLWRALKRFAHGTRNVGCALGGDQSLEERPVMLQRDTQILGGDIVPFAPLALEFRALVREYPG